VSWTDISYLSDEAAAKRIRDDQVDVLIDLAGHTGHNRLALFAWKPAPVQVAWLGYWASTGVAEIDYVIADEVSLPQSHQDQFTETVWYLPHTRMCFSPPTESVAVSPLPAKTNGYITFGSFQNLGKISDEVLALWSKVLAKMPTARLRLQIKQLNDQSMQQLVAARLEKAGIDPSRVELKGGTSRQAYLAAHGEVDVILDTFPFSGGTTTCEALWMGVPTVTLAGQTLIGRQGASMLTNAGLQNWVAKTEAEFVEMAIEHTSDVEALAPLRARLRQQVQSSPLFDAPMFAKHLEQALHQMWNEKINKLNA
jgi:predicted O-linked N-acetylglucosamine transferase (SPINDLY family)